MVSREFPGLLDQFLIGAFLAQGEVTCDRQAIDDWCQPLDRVELRELLEAMDLVVGREPFPHACLNRYWYFKRAEDSRRWFLKIRKLVADHLTHPRFCQS